eukprot:jgi/Mesen1/3307/ME000191S02447
MGQSTCNLVPLLLLVLHAAVAVDCQSLDALRGAGSTRAAEPALGQRPDRNGRADFGASEDFNVSSALHRRSMRERVCWNGPALAYGGAPAGTPRPAYAGPPAGPEHRLMISGEGCASCTVGHVCTFFLHFASDAYFDTTLVMMRELLVLLTGPTTIYARAVPHHTLNRGGSSYLVSYKSWDAGTYAVKITSDCSKMADGVLRSNVLAQLSVEVRNDDGEGGELAGGGVGGGQVAGDEGGESAVRTPCEHGEYARWLLGGPSREGVIAAQVAEAGAAGMSGMWQYTPYTCAEGSTVQPQDFVGQLAAKGVHELSFVGDSHLRSICTHLQFLISAGTPRPAYAGPPAGPEHRLMISGEGCASCTVGHVCTFFLHFASDAYFDTTLVMMRELLVLLTGPTTIYARAVPHHTLNRGGSSYLVSYKSWDAGTYAVKITSDCSKMADGVLRSNVLAQLSVEVRNDDGEGGELAGGGVAGDEGGESAVRTPCEHGEYARWLLGGPSREGVIAAQVAEAGAAGMSGMWQYTPYTCAEGSTVQPQDFVGQLAAKGVHELSFVGDSHLRSICTHLHVWDYDDPKSGQHLRINYYWVDGVYHNGEFGCRNRGSYSGRPKDFPVYSPTSDVIVADGGAWSFQWLVSRPHKHTARFVWRSEAPYPVPLENCWGRRNSALAWANEFARGLSTRYNFQYMDTWPIEAPRYLDTCYKQVGQQWVRDNHYSCPYDDNKKVLGDVGEAVVRYFMQALLHEYLV